MTRRRAAEPPSLSKHVFGRALVTMGAVVLEDEYVLARPLPLPPHMHACVHAVHTRRRTRSTAADTVTLNEGDSFVMRYSSVRSLVRDGRVCLQ